MITEILRSPEGQLQFSAGLSVSIVLITQIITYFTATKSRRIDGKYKLDEINQKREDGFIDNAFEERDYYKKAYLDERAEREKLAKIVRDNHLPIN